MASMFSLEGKNAAIVEGGSGIGEAEAGQVDIVDGPAVTSAFGGVAADRGSLDVVVCTPAINVRNPLLDYTDDDIDPVWRSTSGTWA